MQKYVYLQWFWSRGCKNVSIYNESQIAGAKTIVFAMILKPWLQKTIVFTMNLKLLAQKHKYLSWFWSHGCKNIIIYNESEAAGT